MKPSGCEIAFLALRPRAGVLFLGLLFASVVGISLTRADATIKSRMAPASSESLAPQQISQSDDLLSDEDLLSDDEDLLSDDDSFLTEPEADTPEGEEDLGNALEEHAKLFLESDFPSANTCATCHERQYREWSVSQHAYGQLSPLVTAFQNALNQKNSTTTGDFCLRCHAPTGTAQNEPLSLSNLDRHPASREGITCVVCHRVPQNIGKVVGRFSVVRGDIFGPVWGPTGGDELKRVLANTDQYRVVTDRDEPGRGIHTEARRIFALTSPNFCGGACHEVFSPGGFRTHEIMTEYKRSPASEQGITCQDCHMGKVQGVNAGYDFGPAAVVGGVPTKPRKLTNHFMAGPDYSIIHPGIFPHNVEAIQFKSLREWMQFDVEAGWGTDAFEDSIDENHPFPESWQSIDDRYDARAIIEQQLELLSWAEEKRFEVLRNGYGLSDIIVDSASPERLRFSLEVQNKTTGHNVPTGFDLQRQVFLEVTVTDRDGNVVYISGDRDPNGDLRDQHSIYVRKGLLPLDSDLFNLQSKTVVRLVRGGEREQVLPVNQSVSATPFLRPNRRANAIYGRPLGTRKHRKSILPGDSRRASYDVSLQDGTSHGPYVITVKLIQQPIPVNLIVAIQRTGFDYGMTPKQVAENMVAGAMTLYERRVTVDLQEGSGGS